MVESGLFGTFCRGVGTLSLRQEEVIKSMVISIPKVLIANNLRLMYKNILAQKKGAHHTPLLKQQNKII
jgi:hypothetical protein